MSAAVGFTVANPHALAVILDASETRSIIATRDIFDLSGTKLWARDQPVSRELQRKLMDRQLRHPLEACLYAENGVTSRSLVQSLEELLQHDTPLGVLLRPHDEKLVHSAMHIPLHPVAQLLLSAGQASRPEAFEHALQAMALAGALVLAQGADTRALRQAMLCGLLHDLGELYIDPLHGEAEADRVPDLQSYRHLVVHPHVSRLLVEQLTNYPSEVARAVGEHHERLDGSGYPNRLQGEQVSPLGRLLAVADAVLAALRAGPNQLVRASVALRAVPGEFDQRWVGLVADAARLQPTPQPACDAGELRQRLTRLDESLQAMQDKAGVLVLAADTPALRGAIGLALQLLQRLRTGFNASGLWGGAEWAPEELAEIEAAEAELQFRLRAIQRAARLYAGQGLTADDDQRLRLLCEGLSPA
ncbi:MAG: HD domain-containing phosphohydrolase [Pseudomonadota bacterium]